MTQDFLISVIIPVYNVEKYIKQCVDSVLNQTYKKLEIILIDDGSTDKSSEICDYYKEKDNRVVVVHKENEGQALARNIALEMANGEIIAFVDSDDWIEPTMYSDMVSFMIEKNLDVVFCSANRVTNDKITNDFIYYPDRTVCDVSEIIRKLLTDKIGGQPWFKIYKRYCWNNVIFPVGRIYEDLANSFKPFLNVKNNVGFLTGAYYNYRINPCSTSLSKRSEKCYHIYLAMKDHYEFSIKNYPDVADQCLANTVIHALQTITDYCKNNWVNHQDIINDVQSFLDDNKISVKKCYYCLDTKNNIKIKLYYWSKRMYKVASKLA